jgi:predicted DNA-binding transcriptional regulator AlpA
MIHWIIRGLFYFQTEERETEMTRRVPRASSLERARATAQATTNADQQLQFYSKADVVRMIRVSYVTLWNWMKVGAFPRSRKVGTGKANSKVMWLKHEVDAWMLSRPWTTLQGDDT